MIHVILLNERRQDVAIGADYAISCMAFFDVHGITGCEASELEHAVKIAYESFSKANVGIFQFRDAPKLLSVDHVFEFGKDAKVITIIYGEVGSKAWLRLHEKVLELAYAQQTQYVLRHYSGIISSVRKVSLSGYGVELAIKNTEYKAVDDSNEKKEVEFDEENLHGFNFKRLKELHPISTDFLDAFRMHLKEIQELAPLKQWQVQDLSFQASQSIINSGAENAIETLKQLSQDFPRHARSISRVTVDDFTRQEIEINQKQYLSGASLEPGDSALFINGINLDIDSLDAFQLVDIIKQEERLSSGFFNMGIKREYLSILVNMELSEEKTNYAVDYRDAFPFFLNNLDTDKRYKHWRNSVKLLLEPYYPGMIRPIARNLFTLIFVIEPSGESSRNLLKIAYAFYKHEIPLRQAHFILGNASGINDSGVAVLNLFNYLAVESSYHEALRLVNDMLDDYRTYETIDPVHIKTWFEANYGDALYEDIFGPKSDYDSGRTNGMEFLKRSAIGKTPKVLLNGYVLDDAGISGDKFEETVMLEVMRITPKLQDAVINGQLQDKMNVGNWIMEQKDVVPRHNLRILGAASEKRILDLAELSPCEAKTTSEFINLSVSMKTQCILSKMRYLRKTDDVSTLSLTLWIVADLESAKGRDVVYNAIKHLRHSRKTRLGIIMNPNNITNACDKNSISSLVQSAFRLLPRSQVKQLVTKLMKSEFADALRKGTKNLEDVAVGGMDLNKFDKERNFISCDDIKMESVFVREVIGFKSGQSGFVANGVIFGPFDEQSDDILESDVELIERIIESRGASVIVSFVDKRKIDVDISPSDIVMRSFALVLKHAVMRKRIRVVLGSEKHSTVTLTAEESQRGIMDIVAVIDPLSRSAQKLSSLVELLRKAVNCDLKIVLNPKAKLSEFPLKRFYRYVASPELQFDKFGDIVVNQARFANLPSRQLLTLSIHSPDAWMVENVYAECDIDNIKMEQASSDVVALFSLEHILLEGHCFDEVTGSPPRGLQFVLGTSNYPTQFDTIVMANLGYFQLKANPGAWLLQLREGKSRDIFEISSYINAERSEGEAIRVIIDSFSGRTIRVRVSKKIGMEKRSLLSDDSDDGDNFWSSISSSLTAEKHETINVFSLASGHLYERFMNIMMLSVMKHTQKPVKFWLLKNYLSPQFKVCSSLRTSTFRSSTDFQRNLPVLALEYGFHYALVEYKWPRWLHQQKEKHRVMWGYKILFLDVLFPLDVQKIIFVDADQVVRADLMELMELDLGGAPYGYVPFCDSRKEMDGFRFWKQGYWANHLAGRRYHISALYVIDLQKFRQIAAGDRLRGQYQGLSNDPNSLSNLDQDLPNNMIHQVKIKSLPQEWLWCETWCDDASKAKAKTIDLCNNPLTKEPKLDSAIRIIPEWKDYDKEIKNVLIKVGQKNRSNTLEHSELPVLLMSTRRLRIWQPGNPQNFIFLPDFWLAVVDGHNVGRNKLPKNCVKFEVDPRMTKHDIKEYLRRIYNLPVRNVRTEVKMGDISWSTPADFQYRKAMWKDNDKKFAYVYMSKDFEFTYPSIFRQDVETEELEKFKEQQEKLSVNSTIVNRDRMKVGEFFGI
ncbi:UDP-glucose:Glycoprotein Glucosyltransferase [Dictyocaulus viviparus]|uniref:Large ribosomal subunit protein uL23m n=1 Tax=Dictyocaulus viviparus TaxID=29172 RepID=A0A0D8XG36_DICVI|nr:UDP-glucose:Glycoprotein Glucosyltransferase [Dictyocaulus viviparus]